MFLLSFLLNNVIFLLSFVSQSESFPKPLSAKNERIYLEKFAKEKDMEARNILIEKNMRLVAHIAKKYSQSSCEQEDLISIGTIGLIKAINTFDYTKGIRLATYAARCIDNEILMVMRNAKKSANEISLEEPIGVDREGNEISFMDIVGSSEEEISENVEIKEQIKKMYDFIAKDLSEREKKVIIYRYGLCGKTALTQKELADILGISRSYVSRIEKKALKKLNKCFSGEDYENS
ncbi:MAG: RNA polymerase sporulation sigma factor SigK [Clostridia bacterium]|nr:RNA polymerase sporulation sigma factor SigK [Clostridia bacterium]